jgi:hypothetical protein
MDGTPSKTQTSHNPGNTASTPNKKTAAAEDDGVVTTPSRTPEEDIVEALKSRGTARTAEKHAADAADELAAETTDSAPCKKPSKATATLKKRPSAAPCGAAASPSSDGAMPRPPTMTIQGTAVAHRRGKIYFSDKKQGYRVMQRAYHKVDRVVSFKRGKDAAWATACKMIEDYKSDGE